MTLKALVRQIDTLAENWLPLKDPHDENIVAWADLHGWDASDAECQRLLVRQALLNVAIRQTVTGIEHSAFATPLDSLGIEAPQSLADAVYEAAQRSQPYYVRVRHQPIVVERHSNRSPLPIQLRLLEAREDYEPFCT